MDSYGFGRLFLLVQIAISTSFQNTTIRYINHSSSSASIHIGWETVSNSSMNAIVTIPKQVIENRESNSSRNNQYIGGVEIECSTNLYCCLSQNYNTPFTPTINFQDSLPIRGDVRLKIYNSHIMPKVSWSIKVNSYSVLIKRGVRV